MRPLEFVVGTPQVDYQAHIRNALSLGLPYADQNQRRLNLIANGPSAACLPDDIHDADTMAINGALGLLDPTYWIACDPQALVADFLHAPPRQTAYLVASKCHPAVFKALEDLDVRLWHVDDQEIPDHPTVPVACSATLCALSLAMRLGYRVIHVYGWDLCFSGLEHHATPNPMSSTPERVALELELGDGKPTQHFDTTATWVCEMKDAEKILPMLSWAGMQITIHGRSLVGAILPQYQAAT